MQCIMQIKNYYYYYYILHLKCKTHTYKSSFLIYELSVLRDLRSDNWKGTRCFYTILTNLYLIANAVDFLGYARIFTCQ